MSEKQVFWSGVLIGAGMATVITGHFLPGFIVAMIGGTLLRE